MRHRMLIPVALTMAMTSALGLLALAAAPATADDHVLTPALITEVGVPKLDGSSKEAAHLP
jgi:hypothetical protein